MTTCGRGELVKPHGKEKRRAPFRSAPFLFVQRAGLQAKKSRRDGRANDTPLQRIGAFGQSNRRSGNGTTLLLAVTLAQRVGRAGVKDAARLEARRVQT
jgi:hypothetical protein